jgi:hypothetical protein
VLRVTVTGRCATRSARLGGYGGLFQRTSIITGFAWLTAASSRALERTPPGTALRHHVEGPAR